MLLGEKSGSTTALEHEPTALLPKDKLERKDPLNLQQEMVHVRDG